MLPGLLSRLPLAAFVLALIAGSPAAARAGRSPERIVLVSIDGLPAVEPNAEGPMPALAALAARGVHYTNARGASMLPFPAAAALLTGCGPARTGVVDEVWRGLPAGVPTLAEVLRARGWRSQALPADAYAHAGSGLARGFDAFVAAAPALADSARVDSALAWLAGPGRRFVWLALSFGAPHEAWRRVDGCGPREGATFAVRASQVDAALARLAHALGDDAGALLVIVSGAAPPPAIPPAPQGAPATLLVCGGTPTVRAGAGVHDAVSTVDVAPTLAALAGVSPSGFEGRVLPGFGGPRQRALPAADARAPFTRAWGTGPDAAACAEAVIAALALPPSPRDSVRGSALAALVRRFGDRPRLSLEQALQLERSGRGSMAADALRNVLAHHPEYLEARIAYGEYLVRQHSGAEVRSVLAPVPREGPAAAVAAWVDAMGAADALDFVAAVGAAERGGRLAVPAPELLAAPAALRALGALQDSVKVQSRDLRLREAFADALAGFGLFEAAFQQLHQARALAPKRAEPDVRLAMLLLQLGRTDNALATLQRAVAVEPRDRDANRELGQLLLEQGRIEEARPRLEAAIAAGDREPRALYNVACLRARAGDRPGAMALLEQLPGLGWTDWRQMTADPDLAVLHDEPRWAPLVARMRGN